MFIEFCSTFGTIMLTRNVFGALLGELLDGNCLARVIGCQLGSFLLTYLGLSLGAPVWVTLWDLVVERVERCSVGWKSATLSMGLSPWGVV